MIDGWQRTVPVLPDFTVFRSVDGEGLVSGGGELLGVRVVECERDGLAAEPVTDVVCVAVEEVDTQALVEQVLKILAEVGVDEVAGVLELPGEDWNVSFEVCGTTACRVLFTSRCPSWKWCSSSPHQWRSAHGPG